MRYDSAFTFIYSKRTGTPAAKYEEQIPEDIVKELKTYLSFNQNVGREVAKLIGAEAYANGFIKSLGFKYQYDRFSDMIQYTQNNYFMAKNIHFTQAFATCLSTAIKACIQDFVDAKCIFVY